MQIAATPQRSPLLAQPVRQRAEDPAAGGAQRVADRDRAALGVDDLRVDLPGVDAGQRLDGERLVELDRGDVGPADAGPGQRLVGGLDRREPEVLRLQRVRAAAGDPGQRVDPERRRPRSRAAGPRRRR